MNEDFIPEKSDGEESTPEPAKKTIRRARRTVAPFVNTPVSEKIGEFVSENPEEIKSDSPAPIEEVSEESAKAEETSDLSEIPSKPAEAEAEETEAEEEVAEEKDSDSESDEAADESGEVAAEDSEETAEEKISPIAEAFDWIKSFLFSLTVVIFIFTLVFRGVTVNGGSMLPTLESGEYLIISDLLYTPKTGDIVVVQSPHYKNASEPLIKRIIATGGQTVKINFTTWEVWVDGELLHEDYILRDGSSSMNCEDLKPDENGEAEFTVEPNCIFVMGDHRNDSLDSRSNSVGQIDERYIMGRVVVRLTPFERFGKVE